MKRSGMITAVLLALGILAGFGREILLANLFGVSREVEIFRIGFGLPSILSDSLAISFVAVLMPVLLTGENAEKMAGRRAVFWASGLIGFGVCAIGYLTMPLQARIFAPGFDTADTQMLVFVGRISWLMFLFVILSLPLRALMATENRTWPAASSALLRSLSFSVFLLVSVKFFHSADMIVAGWAAAFAGLSVFCAHFYAIGMRRMFRIAKQVTPQPNWLNVGPILWAIVIVFMTQLTLAGGRLFDRAAASTQANGTLAGLEYSYAVLMAVAMIFATTLNIHLAPQINRALRDQGFVPIANLRLCVLSTVVASAVGLLLAAFAPLAVSLIFETGAFDEHATIVTADILFWQALALGPLVGALLLTQIMLLNGGQRKLFHFCFVKMVIKVVSLMILIRLQFGTASFGQSLIIAELFLATILAIDLFRRGIIRWHSYEPVHQGQAEQQI